jgi:hypothetical protein
MRSVILVVVLLAVAFAGAFAVQVLMAQSKEEGSFGDRVASVMQRQLGLVSPAEEAAEAAMEAAPMEEAPPAGTEGRSMTYSLAPAPPPSPARLADLTIADLEALFRSSTQAELDGLRRQLAEDAVKRDQDGFWTDVRLNMLFMLLSLALPVAFARMRR